MTDKTIPSTTPAPEPLAAPLDLEVLAGRRPAVHRPSRRLVEALAESIQSTRLYPPLIVRPHPRRRRRFEIIDGHARLEALRRLGRRQARCEIWLVDDATADLMATTLNRLRGRNDAKDTARIIKRIVRRVGTDRTARLLALTPRGLTQQLAAARPPPAPPRPEDVLPLHPVTFHLTDRQQARLQAAMAKARAAGGSGRARNTRSQLLLSLIEGNVP